MRARGDPPVCPGQWPMVGHRPALLPALRKGRFGREPSPRLGEVRGMSAIGTEETIDRAGGLVGLLV